MVDVEIDNMYLEIIKYLGSKKAYFEDPSSVPIEFNDIEPIDLTNVIYFIQRLVKQSPTVGEIALLKGYGDIRASEAEYGIRVMSRADYWSDAASEEDANIAKWTYNRKSVNGHMNNKDAGA